MNLTNTQEPDADSDDYCEYDSTWENEDKKHSKKVIFGLFCWFVSNLS